MGSLFHPNRERSNWDFLSGVTAIANKGRFCPCQHTTSMNVGLVASSSIHAKIDHCGSLQSPFYKISKRSREEHMVYLLPRLNEDQYYRIAIGNSLALNQGILKE